MKYTNLIDSHAHVLYDEYEDSNKVIDNAVNNGVNKIMIICCTLDEAYKAIELKKNNNELFDIACGFHPEDTDKIKEEDFIDLEELMKSEYVTALGEIGLDYYWVKDNANEQKILFNRQIDLANKYNKPIIVHSRDAIKDTFDILKEHKVTRTGIIHCYSSSLEMAREFIKLGYYISFAGPVTFKNANEPKRVATNIPIDRLLVETDSPFLTPSPFRGKQNEPMYIENTYEEIARLRDIDVKELIDNVNINYAKLFYKE